MFSVHLWGYRISQKKTTKLAKGGEGCDLFFTLDSRHNLFWTPLLHVTSLAVTELIVYKFAGGKRA